MTLTNKTLPETIKSLEHTLKRIQDETLAKNRKELDSQQKESDQILKHFEKSSFELRKDLLILEGTIFGSSIALASGRTVNNIFILGELSLFISIVSGLICLFSQLKAKEWEYAFITKSSLESYMIMSKSYLEKFEIETTENLIKDYDKLLKSNQSGVLYLLLKLASLEKVQFIFTFLLVVGILLILVSIAPWAGAVESGTSGFINFVIKSSMNNH